MKQRPILFQGAMVRALLDGSKTQTRRLAKIEITMGLTSISGPRGGDGYSRVYLLDKEHDRRDVSLICPYGQPGDQIRVKETFYAFGRWETRFSAKKGRDEWHFVDMTLECGKEYSYPATDSHPLPMRGKRDVGVLPGWWKRPAIFMPSVASRITLEITSVRVERLQDISEADAKAEGLIRYREKGIAPDLYSNGATDGFIFPVDAYSALWEQINGPGSWDANPWVWVISFRAINVKGSK